MKPLRFLFANICHVFGIQNERQFCVGARERASWINTDREWCEVGGGICTRGTHVVSRHEEKGDRRCLHCNEIQVVL